MFNVKAMSRRRRWLAAVMATVLVGAGVAAFALTRETDNDADRGGELPVALEQHLEKLKESLPGNGGNVAEGPNSAAEAEFLERAYPLDTISVSQMDRSKTDAMSSISRPFPSGKGHKGSWVNIGPSNAVYPFTELRNSFSYVPNEYVASGRSTSIVISHFCVVVLCPAWVAAAGGGVWRTWNIRASQPHWDFVTGPLGINAIGKITVDPNDPIGLTLYVGTGEANICGSGCVAGTGLYKTTNGGATWTGPIGKSELSGKGIGEIVVKKGDPKTLYVATTTALRGMSSVCCGGVTRPVPGAAKWGLYKSTDGGATWTFIHNGSANASDCTGSATEFANGGVCSPRGVRNLKLDPSNQDIVYASSFARGVWRSNDAGATWTQIHASLNPAFIGENPAFDVAALPNGKTRMYLAEGGNGTPYSRLSRSDDVATGAPTFTDLTSTNVADTGYAWFNICTGQCSYDLFVVSPKGHPDMVYVGGSYMYGETIANKRAVVLSTDAGVSGTDMTFDGTDMIHPNGLHPDQHSLAVNPANPLQFFETNDGGLMRSSGTLVNRSSWCDDPNRGLAPDQKIRCQQMLSAIPSKLDGINKGLSTLQFQSLSVSPFDSSLLQGGTQDNGTWQSTSNPATWNNTMIGDGGQSGFDIAVPEFRFHNFFDATPDVNFNNGNMADWIFTGDPIFGQPGNMFYVPMISDPKVSGTLFAGTGLSVYRTQTFGLGGRTREEANRICNEFTGTFEAICGDWAPLGANGLTSAFWGDRSGGAVAAVQRTVADNSTVWAGSTRGRLFISHNADTADPAAVTWTRIDSPATPNRFVSGIYVDPADANHAWISFSGFNSATPTTPGHLFEVTFHPGDGTATWTDRSYDFGDVPATAIVRDDVTGDLFAASDFGVLRLAEGTTTWTAAASGMPNVEVAGLTILPNKRILYAASHGLGAWKLDLRKPDDH